MISNSAANDQPSDLDPEIQLSLAKDAFSCVTGLLANQDARFAIPAHQMAAVLKLIQQAAACKEA